MIPKTPTYERSGPYYIDGVFPIQHRERYREIFRFACYLLAIHIPALYENRFTRVRICIRCYNEVHPNLRPNYECKMEWHSISEGSGVRLECARCDETLLQRRSASECLDCLEHFLDHEYRMGNHYVSPVGDHYMSDEE